jgi:transposase
LRTVLPSENLIASENLRLDKIERVHDGFVLHAHVHQKARGPACGQVSCSRHSEYERRLQDLPWQRSAVEMWLKVRRFRSRNPCCSRKMFAEPVLKTAQSHSRQTLRVG